MYRWLCLNLFIFAGSALSSAESGWLDKVQSTVLENGIRVICSYKEDAKFTALEIWIKGGIGVENEQTRGCSHFFEHLVFRGSKQYPEGPDEIAEHHGAIIKAYTDKDYNRFATLGQSSSIEKIFRTLADCVAEPVFDDNAIFKERQIMIDEIADRKLDALHVLSNSLYSHLYPNSPYATPTSGTAGINEAVNISALRQYHKYAVTGNRITVVFLGGTSLKTAVEWTKAALGGLPKGEPLTVKAWDYSKIELETKSAFPGAWLGFAFPTSPSKDIKQWTACELLSRILLNPSYGLLSVELSKHGINVPQSYIVPTLNNGLITFAVVAENQNIELVRQIVNDSLEKLQAISISPSKLKPYAEMISQEIASMQETIESAAYWIGFCTVLLNYDYIKDYHNRLKLLNVDDLPQTVKRFFAPDKLSTLIIEHE